MEAGSIPEPKVSNRENCILLIQIDIDVEWTIKVFQHRMLRIFLREIGMFCRNLPINTESDIDLHSFFITSCQEAGDVLTECRRAFADVNGYVEHCAFDTAYEFALGIWHALIVKTAHHTV